VTQIWNTLIFRPMLNGLLFLYSLLARNFGLSIMVFTVLVRLITLPITQQQMRSARSSQELQPQLAELQKKYKDNRDKLAEEQMKLYREHGVNPLGCLVPTLIQFPIWIGLYQSIINALPNNPLQLLNLGRYVYLQFPLLSSLIPLNSKFLWLNLGRPDPYYILPILTVATMWVQQKMMATPSADPQQQAMSESMSLTMPLMFGLITFQLASGLALYFVATNVFGIVQQYFVSGWGGLAPMLGRVLSTEKASPRKGKRDERKK
jgi:YidC/Oxa1 family membrane protein insertase